MDREKALRDLDYQLRACKGQLAATKLAKCTTRTTSTPSPPSTLSPSNNNTKPWLIIGIPTIPRAKDEYLSRVLPTILNQLAVDPMDPLFNQIHVYIMNNRPGEHEAFEKLREHYRGTPSFHFMDNPRQADRSKIADIPLATTDRVFQQIMDLVELLFVAADRSHYYLLAEDDFEFCPHIFRALSYIISKATFVQPGWISLRLSYGMNGFLVKGADLRFITEYLLRHAKRRPPDHLMSELTARETEESRRYFGERRNMAWKYNILNHIGLHSTLRTELSPQWPGCYEELKHPVNFECEAFDPVQCPSDDLWPCDFPKMAEARNLMPALRFL